MSKNKRLSLIEKKVCDCTKCPSLVSNRSQTVFGDGDPESRIVFVGEAPGRDEDIQGKPFVGRAGKLLNEILERHGWQRENVYILNTLKCRPPSNRNPTEAEANNCRPFLDLQLKVINPKIIICLGAVAAHNLLGIDTPISQLRGQWFEYKDDPVDAKVLCVWHPAYLLRNRSAIEGVTHDFNMIVEEYNECH